MHIFFVDKDPVAAAQCLHDGHLVSPDDRLLKLLAGSSALSDHPLTGWMRESAANWRWLLRHLIAKAAELKWRGLSYAEPGLQYIAGFDAVVPILCKSAGVVIPGSLTAFPRTMPKEYRWPDSDVDAWRLFYFNENHCGEWTRRALPQWFVRS